MKVGDSIAMTPLAKEIELNGSNPHVNTIRNKVTEGFVLRDVFTNFKPTYDEKGQLIRIEKIEKKNDSEMITTMLANIKIDVSKIKEEIEKLKK
jgi:hypothetical protein